MKRLLLTAPSALRISIELHRNSSHSTTPHRHLRRPGAMNTVCSVEYILLTDNHTEDRARSRSWPEGRLASFPAVQAPTDASSEFLARKRSQIRHAVEVLSCGACCPCSEVRLPTPAGLQLLGHRRAKESGPTIPLSPGFRPCSVTSFVAATVCCKTLSLVDHHLRYPVHLQLGKTRSIYSAYIIHDTWLVVTHPSFPRPPHGFFKRHSRSRKASHSHSLC